MYKTWCNVGWGDNVVETEVWVMTWVPLGNKIEDVIL